MAYLIIIFTFAAVWHWVWENIVLPERRHRGRFRLLEMRDEIRDLMYANSGDAALMQAAEILDVRISNMVAYQRLISFSAMRRIKKDLESNPELRNKVERRIKIVNDCEHEVIRKIDDDLVTETLGAVMSNSGAWGIYLVPLLFGFMAINKCYAWIQPLVESATAAPKSELEGLEAMCAST